MNKESALVTASSVSIVDPKRELLEGVKDLQVNGRPLWPSKTVHRGHVVEQAVLNYVLRRGYPELPDLALDGESVEFGYYLWDYYEEPEFYGSVQWKFRVFSLGCGVLMVRPVRTREERQRIVNSEQLELDAIYIELPEADALQEEIVVDVQLKLRPDTRQALTPEQCHPLGWLARSRRYRPESLEELAALMEAMDPQCYAGYDVGPDENGVEVLHMDTVPDVWFDLDHLYEVDLLQDYRPNVGLDITTWLIAHPQDWIARLAGLPWPPRPRPAEGFDSPTEESATEESETEEPETQESDAQESNAQESVTKLEPQGE